MRALVVTNMYPSAGRPALGSFVRDQVRALRRIDGIDVQVRAFSPGGPRSYLRGCRDLRRRYAARASTSSTPTSVSWPGPGPSVKAHHRVVTLDGNDLYHPRSRRPATAVRGRMGLIGAPTTGCAAATSGAGTAGPPVAILACGVDVDFFRPLDRAAARQRLGLER